jgi:hypothetical protein
LLYDHKGSLLQDNNPPAGWKRFMLIMGIPPGHRFKPFSPEIMIFK